MKHFKNYCPIFFSLKNIATFILLVTLQLLYCHNNGYAQHAGHGNKVKALTENDFYKIVTVMAPTGAELEVGGLAKLPDGRLAVCTRLGEIWILENAAMMNNSKPYFKLFASGLHEPLGLAYKDGALYVAQRAELTKISDTNGDDIADLFETVTTWELSGNYCEYNHGPVIGADGNFYINFNLGDNGMGSGAEPFFGEMGSHALWRGWMVQVTPTGVLTPFASGFRSPAGIGTNSKGELFYTENQGGWVGTGYITHVQKNDFFGHPSGLKSADKPGSTLKTRITDIPTDNPLFHDAVKRIPGMKLPSVRLPHGILGVSLSGLVEDNTNGGFGPFTGQYFVGDEGHANIMRVFMEKVNGEYQGAAFPFRKGFMSGILRLEWGNDRSIFVGMSDRGWNSNAPFRHGLQRLVWTGNMPFEIKTIKAKPDGFELEFTSPVNKESALDPANYNISGFDYKYHQAYGSEVYDKKECKIEAIKIADDGLTVRLVLNNLREGYIHEVKCTGLRSVDQTPLLHDFGYYSLNAIPAGEKLSLQDKDVIKISYLKQEEDNVKKQLNVGSKPNAIKNKKNETSNTLPSSWVNGPDMTIVMGTKPGLKFDIDKFSVKPGAKIKLVFKNNDDMQHNFVLVEPGTADQIGKLAMELGLEAPSMHYVPKSNSVLQHTRLLQPNTSETIYFTAPEKTGTYPFICTYPGHYTIMKGEMDVVQ
ncbi:plastocyanin/azurin family copper-binding protein [Pedobacter nyackensis]|uniref:plastocyanin/azurin family copper-binding protein n=1 Tax=Pedobacter nyackensis TaxID=475255 RepID=UPI00292CBA10|nr:plastocyanin/azurin family copper-binding protein [Pedobacter nyackensis]